MIPQRLSRRRSQYRRNFVIAFLVMASWWLWRTNHYHGPNLEVDYGLLIALENVQQKHARGELKSQSSQEMEMHLPDTGGAPDSASQEDPSEDDDSEGDDERSASTPQQDNTGYLPALAHLPPIDKTSRKTFGACLKIKDDNHWLVEWLPYHWFLLPLDHITVAVDPESRTSPLPILERYRRLIDIELVDAEQYVGREVTFRNAPFDRFHVGPQRAFYSDCLRSYRRRGFRYIMVGDTDEFVTVDPQVDRLRRGVVLDILERERSEMDRRTQPCISMPRMQMCPNPSTSFTPTGLSIRSEALLTHHFVSGARLLRPKNIVDLAGLDSDYYDQLDLTKGGSTHDVIYPHCEPVPDWASSSLRVLHYTGTREQITFRVDPRASEKKPVRQCGRKVEVSTTYMSTWLPEFVQAVGKDQAEALLDRVGETEGWPPYQKPTR